MKTTAIALAVTLGLAAGAANAGTLGTLSMGDNYFNNSVTGKFADFWTFTTPTLANLGADAIANYSFKGFTANITEIELLTPAQASVDNDTNYLAKATGSAGGIYANLLSLALPAGNYVLEVEGNNTLKSGGYHADINLSPVPEASEWAMMASGLGLFGFIASRRSKKAA